MWEVETAKTTAIVSAMIEQLLVSVWRGVADKNIAKMAPETIKNQTDHAMQSFVYQSYAEKLRSKNNIKIDLDPISTARDNYAFGAIETEKRTVRKQSKDLQATLFGDRSRSILSDIEKVSVTSANLKTIQQKTEKSLDKSKRQTFFVSLGYEEEAEDNHLAKLRRIQGEKQAEQIKTRRMLEERLVQQRSKAQAQQKMLKQKGVFTYDYDGLCCGISPGKDQGDMIPKIKQNLGNQDVKSKGHIAIEPTQIQNQKMHLREEMSIKSQQSKQKPQFAETQFSLAEVLNDQSKISEGVKITELRSNSNNLVLQNKHKKKQLQRQYRLKDYKSLTKQKSFVEFSLTSTNKKNSLYELSKTPSLNHTIGDIKSKTLRVQRRTPKSRQRPANQIRSSQTHSILQNALGRGLPFIRTKGLRFYDIGSTNTFRTLELNSTSRKSSKVKSSRIRIDDSELFEQTILN